MSHEIPADLLAAFSRFVEDNLGLHFPEKRYADLERGLRAAADDLGICDPASWARDLMQSCWSKEKIELLAAHLTVGETYFLRDAKAFEALETTVIPAILRAPERRGRSLRVWSAACCTGEEPYSLALILSRMCPALVGTPVSILATDINPRFLQKACAGIYGRWSFRCIPTI